MFRRQQVLWKASWVRYAIAVAAVAAGFLLRKAVTAYVGEELATYITFYPAVMVAALLAGLGPGLVATALTVAVVDYWVVSPKELFWRGHPAEAAGVVLFSLLGVFLTVLIELYRRAREKAAAYGTKLALRRSQEALHEVAALHRLALEAGNLGTWSYDILTGEVFWDERCRDLFGVPQRDRIKFAPLSMAQRSAGATTSTVRSAMAPTRIARFRYKFGVSLRASPPSPVERFTLAQLSMVRRSVGVSIMRVSWAMVPPYTALLRFKCRVSHPASRPLLQGAATPAPSPMVAFNVGAATIWDNWAMAPPRIITNP